MKRSVFSVFFMPHADYPDEDVDFVYAQFHVEVARSKNRKTKIVIAVIGMRGWGQAQDDDDDQLVGQTIFGHRSEREEHNLLNGAPCMATWQRTHFLLRRGHTKTANTGISLTTLSCREIWGITSFFALSDVNIGSNHRPVQVKFSISNTKKKQTRDGKWCQEIHCRSDQVRQSPCSLHCTITIPPTWILKSKIFSWRK